ncbi:hypothetical protein SERLADRAFT_403708 [Serpula lacrymans var. lacrymans S7.9]|uniref:Protein kinase domain-containing protein n=1 Tax=Serpula lacrymans var. lacrymans (strain S7.9) TaxID=578457 RepID=F8PDS4_SERL9|nr:uncharacterized protein SERLADRAFT_403708 [Serpula lacrymans var. lacrymans S7.9]EGO18894.1 hypothetical protein SERLADRAFT_403708 [Serpula lacrymans var. lacrymans S7.9]
MFYQTWHQSLHFAVTHQIFSNEEQFIMTLREENTVWVSEPLQWHYEGDPEETKLAFAKASLFLAHALDTHLPSLSGPFKPQAAPPAIDAKVKVNAPGSNKGSPEPSALPSSHPMTLRSVTKKMLEKALPSVPGEIVFGAKGIHTLTLKLTAMSPHRYPCRQKPLYALALFSEKLGLSALYKGQFEGENVFIKMVVDDENSEQSLIREFYLYSVLSSLQGVLIPKCIGLFRVDKSTQILVTSDCGVRLKSFKQLDDIQSQALLKSVRQIHALRVCHNDLAPRNVVQDDKGKLTIVDFGLGENSHRCDGDCLEILDLETQLGEHLL